MTKERKILAAILGAGVLALGVDRLMSESPATSPQAVAAKTFGVDAFAPEIAPTSAWDAPDTPEDASASSLASRLEQAAAFHALPSAASRNAFAPGPAWMEAITPPAPVEATQQREAEHFEQNHRLMAVMIPGKQGIAVVNNKPLRLGQKLDGHTLMAVERHAVTFQGPAGQQVMLKLDPTNND